MEKRIRERYNNDILQETMRRFAITRDQIRELGTSESYIYEFEQDQKSYILRIAHSIRRSVPLIQAEVDWINFLAEGGASVAKAILSEQGNLVERIDDQHGGHFLATAFVKARGDTPDTPDWNPALFETYGQVLGKMHALTKAYKPSDPACKRLQWNDPKLLQVEQILPATELLAAEKYRQVMKYLNTLPQDSESYGLIHQDAHSANLFVDETGSITFFDFDDCAYGWFMLDIAIVLFYAVLWGEDATRRTHEFMPPFLRGYKRENRIDAMWLKQIPYFLKLREIELYAVIHRSSDVDNLEDAWDANYMRNRKYKIENDAPYIDFDFESLAEYL